MRQSVAVSNQERLDYRSHGVGVPTVPSPRVVAVPEFGLDVLCHYEKIVPDLVVKQRCLIPLLSVARDPRARLSCPLCIYDTVSLEGLTHPLERAGQQICAPVFGCIEQSLGLQF
jgi:hypothetical protein